MHARFAEELDARSREILGRKLSVLAAALALSFVMHSHAAPAQSGFVSVKGRHFQRDGKPYYYAGANF